MKRMSIFVACLFLTLSFGVMSITPPEVKAKPKNSDELKPYPKCKGPKKRIAIYRFKDGVNNNYSRGIRDGLLQALEYELQQSGCFIVLVTNEDLSDAATEIGHGQSGMAAGGNRSPQTGKQLGAQILVQGLLYEVAYTGGKKGGVKVPSKLTGGIGGSIGMAKQEAKIVIMVRMFDPETRILLFNEKAEGYVVKQKISATAKVEGVKAGGALDKETPLGDAALRAIHNSVRIIIKKMNKRPWQATILKVDGNRVLIRGGKPEGLQPGTVLNVFKPGEMIEDPDTGEMLQTPATQLGQVRITQVMEKMSYCEIVSGPVMRGMWVRMVQSP